MIASISAGRSLSRVLANVTLGLLLSLISITSLAATLTINNNAAYATQTSSTVDLTACSGGWISGINVAGDGNLVSWLGGTSNYRSATWNLSTPDGGKSVSATASCTSSYSYSYICGSYSCNCGFWSCGTCYNYCTATGYNYWSEGASDTITLDTTRPAVNTTTPANAATDVPVTISAITATFSEPVNLPAGAFTVNNGATGSQGYSAGTNQATFTLSAPLTNATTYTATIAGSVTDLAGNQILAPVTWSFTTPPRLTVADSVAPTDDRTIDFGNVTVGTSQDEIITVYNNGSADLNIGGSALSNSLAAPFAIVADACSNTVVSPAGNCTITVRYSPTTSETYVTSSDSFDIPTDDAVSPSVVISISGTGTPVPVPKIRITDSSGAQRDLSVIFAGAEVSQTANATVTITNRGTLDLVIGNVGESDPLAGPFSFSSDTCSGQTLVPSASCTITLNFNPTDTAKVRDSFSIPSNDPNTPVVTVDVIASASGVAGNTPPPAPLQVFPADKQVDVASPITFLWEQEPDADGDVLHHELVVCTKPSFTGCEPVVVAKADFILNSIAVGGFGTMFLIGSLSLAIPRRRRQLLMLAALLAVAASGLIACSSGGDGNGGTASNATPSSTTISSLNPGTTYYWKVLVIDSKGSATSSVVQSFTTQ